MWPSALNRGYNLNWSQLPCLHPSTIREGPRFQDAPPQTKLFSGLKVPLLEPNWMSLFGIVDFQKRVRKWEKLMMKNKEIQRKILTQIMLIFWPLGLGLTWSFSLSSKLLSNIVCVALFTWPHVNFQWICICCPLILTRFTKRTAFDSTVQ